MRKNDLAFYCKPDEKILDIMWSPNMRRENNLSIKVSAFGRRVLHLSEIVKWIAFLKNRYWHDYVYVSVSRYFLQNKRFSSIQCDLWPVQDNWLSSNRAVSWYWLWVRTGYLYTDLHKTFSYWHENELCCCCVAGILILYSQNALLLIQYLPSHCLI